LRQGDPLLVTVLVEQALTLLAKLSRARQTALPEGQDARGTQPDPPRFERSQSGLRRT
jgi:hypothetical protein